MADPAAYNPETSDGKLTFIVSLSSERSTASRRKQELQHSLIRSHAACVGHRGKKARKAYLRTRLHQSRQASNQQPNKQPDCPPQLRTTLYKPPPSQGLQVINPFDDAPDTLNGRDIYQLVQFYQTWTPRPDSVLTVAIKQRVCLYALATHSATVLHGLGLKRLSDDTELNIKSTALATLRSYLNLPNFDSNTVVHALSSLCIGCCFRGEITETRTHLKAMSAIVGRGRMDTLPRYLQQIIAFCDILAAIPSLAPTIFDLQHFSTGCLGDVSDEPCLSAIATNIIEDMTAAAAPPIFHSYAAELVKFANILLCVYQRTTSGANVPIVYHQAFRVASGCLALADRPEVCSSDRQLVRRLSLIIILWVFALFVPIGGCKNFPVFTNETILSFDSPETQWNLRRWNAAVVSTRIGAIMEQNDIIHRFSCVVSSEVESDMPSIGTFIHEYSRLSLERSASGRPLGRGRQPEGVTLREKMLGPILARWPVVPAAC